MSSKRDCKIDEVATDAGRTSDKSTDDEGGKDEVASDEEKKTTTSYYWRKRIETSIAKSREIKGGNFVQLSTVDPDSLEPRCRTMVFRGFLPIADNEMSCVMKMVTDLRQKKVAEVSSSFTSDRAASNCELLWWFSNSNEQYRIRGKLQFVGEDSGDQDLVNARKEEWEHLSDSVREQFYWNTPGAPYEPLNTLPEGGRDKDGNVLPPPRTFLLTLLHPQYVDYFLLGDDYRQVDELNGETWSKRRINP